MTMFRNVLMAKAGGKEGGDDVIVYTELQKIKASSVNAYILTDIIPTENDIIRMRYSTNQVGEVYVFASNYGAWNANPNYWLVFKCNNSTQINLWAFSGFKAISHNTVYGTAYNVEINLQEKYLKINDVKTNITVGVKHEQQPPIRLLNESSANSGLAELYSFYVERNGVAVADYIPIRLEKDCPKSKISPSTKQAKAGDVGYIDRVSGLFYGNAGDGVLIGE